MTVIFVNHTLSSLTPSKDEILLVLEFTVHRQPCQQRFPLPLMRSQFWEDILWAITQLSSLKGYKLPKGMSYHPLF